SPERRRHSAVIKNNLVNNAIPERRVGSRVLVIAQTDIHIAAGEPGGNLITAHGPLFRRTVVRIGAAGAAVSVCARSVAVGRYVIVRRRAVRVRTKSVFTGTIGIEIHGPPGVASAGIGKL